MAGPDSPLPLNLIFLTCDKCPKVAGDVDSFWDIIPASRAVTVLTLAHHRTRLRYLAMMLSQSLSFLFLQAFLAVLTRSESHGLNSHTANYDTYNELQNLFDSARSTAVDGLQKRNGSCTEADIKIRREW